MTLPIGYASSTALNVKETCPIFMLCNGWVGWHAKLLQSKSNSKQIKAVEDVDETFDSGEREKGNG